MRAAVRKSFLSFTENFEGSTNYFYCDMRGYVTIGFGNLVDPLGLAAGLVFLRPSGLVATPSEVSSAWLKVKNRPDLKRRGGGAYASLTDLRATDESILALVDRKLSQFEAALKGVFPEWEEWPADAQLGALSMAWAMGPGFTSGWPAWTAACRGQNWRQAALNCHMADFANPGLVPRNAANVTLFRNAALAACPETLYYPRVL